jgi:ribosomal protein S18 acetylase RimI-like enzyme
MKLKTPVIMRKFKADTMVDPERAIVANLYESLIRFEADLAKEHVNLTDTQMKGLVEEFVNTTLDYGLVAFNAFKEPVGLLFVDKGQPYEIAGLYVSPEVRSSGVGERLIRVFQVNLGNIPVQVQCFVGNLRAMEFYKRVGFEFELDSMFNKGTLPSRTAI